jgi:3-methyladenine DNA glycosylase AlkD
MSDQNINSAFVLKILTDNSDLKQAAKALRFFKTGKGDYGEGDKFLGISNPAIKDFVKKFWKDLSLADIEDILKSEWHEVRFFALSVMRKRADKELAAVYEIFIRNVEHVNNWDLVDTVTPYITGRYWYETGDYSKLWEYANSKNLWKERISILSSFYNMRKGEIALTIALAEHFLHHRHDLIHKAAGWALREAGKRDLTSLLAFLDKFASTMPRTMLRYSLEKLPADKRKYYMALK